ATSPSALTVIFLSRGAVTTTWSAQSAAEELQMGSSTGSVSDSVRDVTVTSWFSPSVFQLIRYGRSLAGSWTVWVVSSLSTASASAYVHPRAVKLSGAWMAAAGSGVGSEPGPVSARPLTTAATAARATPPRTAL